MQLIRWKSSVLHLIILILKEMGISDVFLVLFWATLTKWQRCGSRLQAISKWYFTIKIVGEVQDQWLLEVPARWSIWWICNKSKIYGPVCDVQKGKIRQTLSCNECYFLGCGVGTFHMLATEVFRMQDKKKKRTTSIKHIPKRAVKSLHPQILPFN